jgi:hypothetical protein
MKIILSSLSLRERVGVRGFTDQMKIGITDPEAGCRHSHAERWERGTESPKEDEDFNLQIRGQRMERRLLMP